MIWRDLSIMWTIIHTLVLFIMLYEPRYTGKKNILLTCATMIPLILVNFVLLMVLGLDAYNPLMFLTLSLPSLIIFWLLARNRDGRFLFTFCLVDTVTLGITYLTNILDILFVPGEFIFAAAVRFAVYPLIEWAVIKKLRPTYLEVQRFTKKGWGHFGFISALFYVGIILIPTPITRDSEALPLAFLMIILMPTVYGNIIVTLRNLKVSHETAQQEAILRLQMNNMATRMEELNEADKKFRMERHNFRHKLKTIASLVETGQYDELSALLEEYNESIKEGQVTRYCKSPVIDAVLGTYLRRAEKLNIRLNVATAFPDEIPAGEVELATVLANALENAICACEKLEESQRYIDLRVLSYPRFLIHISNSFDGEVTFDEDGIPVGKGEDHGFGTRSIAAFCEKQGVYYSFHAEDNKFTLQLNF